MSLIEKRLAELSVVLPKPAPPVANYVPFVRSGNLLFVSGQLPLGADGKLAERHIGKLAPDTAVDPAREAARLAAINVLAQARAALGDLDRVAQVVRLGGFFNVASRFDPLAQAMNGASDLIAELFGAAGRHARTTVGVAASADERARRSRGPVRDQGLMPVNAPAWLIERPIAHRGLHDRAKGVIENTLAAAEAAIAGGFAIECDIQMSIDGEAFVFHDETLDRLTGDTGALIEMSAAAIRRARLLGGDGDAVVDAVADRVRRDQRSRLQTIPTFAEFLALVAGRTPVICELKSRFDGDWRIADRAASLAAEYDGPLAFKSFDHDLIGYLRLRRPHTHEGPCPLGIVAEASYDDPSFAALAPSKSATGRRSNISTPTRPISCPGTSTTCPTKSRS